jgi:hypothetical protein
MFRGTNEWNGVWRGACYHFCMETWIGAIVFLVIWIGLQVWVLPRLGVPT